MKCPICKSELLVTGQEHLETLNEHVSNPNDEPSLKNKYECLNERCESREKLIWNEDGDLYHQHVYENGYDFNEKYSFIDGNDGAFGSFARRVNVEIYKKDENFLLCTLFGRKIFIKYLYKSNDDGDILKRTWKFEILRKNGSFYISGWRMLIHMIRTFHKNSYERFDNPERFESEYLELRDWQKKNWWRRVASWYARAYLFLAGSSF
jgi:hypothetical protein